MKKAVITLSGGLDSSTCLAIAKAQDFSCYAMTFDYGQRNDAELAAAKRIAQVLGVVEHKIFAIDIAQFRHSALTDMSLDLPTEISPGIPITYVPARNTIFLSIALAWAEVIGARDIFLGANKIDYESYPDCRPEYLEAYVKVANLATKAGVEGEDFKIHAPLLHLDKAEIIREGLRYDIDYSLTFSCYDKDSEGKACGVCESCQYRAEGFKQAGVVDPTVYR